MTEPEKPTPPPQQPPRHLLKLGIQTQHGAFSRGVRDNVAAAQYVFTFDAVQWAFR